MNTGYKASTVELIQGVWKVWISIGDSEIGIKEVRGD